MSNIFTLADVPAISKQLIDFEMSSEILGFMAALKASNEIVYNAVLSSEFEISVHKVADSCFASAAPAEDQDKYFIATTVGTDCDNEDIPQSQQLFSSAEAAHAAVVEIFKLESRFKTMVTTTVRGEVAYV